MCSIHVCFVLATHAHTHARVRAQTHARTYALTHTHTFSVLPMDCYSRLGSGAVGSDVATLPCQQHIGCVSSYVIHTDTCIHAHRRALPLWNEAPAQKSGFAVFTWRLGWTQPRLMLVVCLHEAGRNQARSCFLTTRILFFEKGSCKVHDEPFQPGLNCLHAFFVFFYPASRAELSCKCVIALMCLPGWISTVM